MFRAALVLALGCVVASVNAQDASEQVPPSNVRGETYNGGPTNYFGGKKDKAETKDDKTEKKDEKKKEKKDEKKKDKKDDKAAAAPADAPADPAAKPASPWGDSALAAYSKQFDNAAGEKPALSSYDQDHKYRNAVARLSTSGWREAQDELVSGGRTSVPYLIEGMNSSANAYNNGGHTRANASRALRQRPVSEVCAEILRTIVTNRSNFKGELPGADAQAWQAWYSAHGEVAFK